ncbi:hypothetical protein LCGC14_0955530 [marine sediment metagenome]|uniref:Uncharacterized protein n=1 Tax=marine sediment metagenome TaxID=412755 RepID=A0A0F9RMG1_9ZZZZ
MSELIKALYLGIPNVKKVYRSANVYCNVDEKHTCMVMIPEYKAVQLMKDCPEEWEFPDIMDKEFFIRDFDSYNNRMIAHAKSKKGIKISYSDDRPDEYYPEDAVISISKPKKKVQPKPIKPAVRSKE